MRNIQKRVSFMADRIPSMPSLKTYKLTSQIDDLIKGLRIEEW